MEVLTSLKYRMNKAGESAYRTYTGENKELINSIPDIYEYLIPTKDGASTAFFFDKDEKIINLKGKGISLLWLIPYTGYNINTILENLDKLENKLNK